MTLNVFYPTALSAQSETMTVGQYLSGNGLNAGATISLPHAVQRPPCWTARVVDKLLSDLFLVPWTQEGEQGLLLSPAGVQARQSVDAIGANSEVPGTTHYPLGSIMLQGQQGPEQFIAITDGQQRSLCLSWFVSHCVRLMAKEGLASSLDLEPLITRGAAKVAVRQQNALAPIFHELLAPLCLGATRQDAESLVQACAEVDAQVKQLTTEARKSKQHGGGTPMGMLVAIETGMARLINALREAEANTVAQPASTDLLATPGQWAKLVKARLINQVDVTVIAQSPVYGVERAFVSVNDDGAAMDKIDIAKVAAMEVGEPGLAARACHIFDDITRMTLSQSTSATRDKERKLDMTYPRAALSRFYGTLVWGKTSARNDDQVVAELSRLARTPARLSKFLDEMDVVVPWIRAWRGQPTPGFSVPLAIQHFIDLHPTRNERLLTHMGALSKEMSSSDRRAVVMLLVRSHQLGRLAVAGAKRDGVKLQNPSVAYARALDDLSDNLAKKHSGVPALAGAYASALRQAVIDNEYWSQNMPVYAKKELMAGPKFDLAKASHLVLRLFQQGAQQPLPRPSEVHAEHFVAQKADDATLQELIQQANLVGDTPEVVMELAQARHKQVCNSFGNLFLLDQSLNQSLGNASPSAKQEALRASQMSGQVKVPSDLLNLCSEIEWLSAIEDRTTTLAQELVGHLNIDWGANQ